MSNPPAKPLRSALITGASSGLGALFARRLAEQGYDLILVARRTQRLTALAEELHQAHGVQALALTADLSDPQDQEYVAQVARQRNDLELLVNNAGFGTTGSFRHTPFEKHQAMIEVHIMASTGLMYAALPGMVQRGRGAVINVASMAAFFPFAGSANYSATKAYLVNLSQAVDTEVRKKGVRVQVLCPGYTYTEFHDTGEFTGFQRSQLPRLMWVDASSVVDASLKGLARGKAVVVPGLVYQLIYLFLSSGPLNRLAREVVSAWLGR